MMKFKLNFKFFVLRNQIRFLILFLFFSLSNNPIFSQSCANYSVTRTTGITYTTLIGNNPSNFLNRNVSTNYNDDARTYPTPIGFDFYYLGLRYVNFCASVNGFIDFSSNTADGNGNGAYGSSHGANQFSSGGSTTLTLAAFYGDEWTGTQGTAPFSSSLVYKTTGTAPNRVLTVEWIDIEEWAGSVVSPPSNLNFQIKIYETSGIIEFVYGTMTAGNGVFSFACGINAAWPTGTPTSAQLLTQQTVNTTSFNNTPKNNLSSLPSSNTKITFSPPAPSAAPSSLTFSAIATTSTVLNWTDNANNELGYVIYNSTDGTNYYFNSQVAANSVSANIIGLLPSTSYSWQVYAITEGNLGSSLNGTMSTLAAGTITSATTGDWNTPATWNCTCIPTDGDFVTIANGHNVTVDGNASCYELTIGQGTSGQLTIGNAGGAKSMTVSNNINVQNGGTVTISNNNFTHSLTIKGNIINNGIFDLAPTANRVCNTTFNKNGNQSITGLGATTNFNLMTVDLGLSSNNILEVASSNFSVLPSNFLTLVDGTFKLSTASTETLFSNATTMDASTRIWVNHASANLSTGNSLTLFGSLRVTSGLLTIGDATDENLISHVGNITIDGGTLNIAGRLTKLGFTSLTNLEISSGLLTVPTIASTSGASPFSMDEKGSTFNFSGGKIVIQRPGAGNVGYLNTGGTVGSITGGTLQIGNSSTPANQIIQINSSIAIYDLLVGDAVAVQAALNTNSLLVKNNVVINSGTLNANAINMSVGATWNNGGNFNGGTGSVTLNGTAAQQIRGTATTTFNNLTLNNSSGTGVTLLTPANVSGALTLSNGKLFTDATNILTMLAGSTSGAGSSNCFVDGPINKIGNTAFTFPTGSGTKWARIGIGAPSASSTFKAQYFQAVYSSTAVAATPTPALHHVSTKEYWQLDRAVGTGSATVTLFWEDSNFSGIYDCTAVDLRVAHWDAVGSAWENAGNIVTTSGACTGATPGSVSTNAVVSNFSPFTFGARGIANNPLPITLIEFEAKPSGDLVNLVWTTASELNSDFFTVEKSNDGINFISIDKIKGAGTCSSKHCYTSIDMAHFPNITYYRLKVTDLDNKISYSPVIVLKFPISVNSTIYPNPNNGSQFVVTISDLVGDEVVFELFDSFSKNIFTKSFDNTKQNNYFMAEIKLDYQLQPGVYYLKASNQQELFKKKIIIYN